MKTYRVEISYVNIVDAESAAEAISLTIEEIYKEWLEVLYENAEPQEFQVKY